MRLEVRHATDGNGTYRPCKVVNRTIAAWYSPDKVLDNVGDVWFVEKKDDYYITIG